VRAPPCSCVPKFTLFFFFPPLGGRGRVGIRESPPPPWAGRICSAVAVPGSGGRLRVAGEERSCFFWARMGRSARGFFFRAVVLCFRANCAVIFFPTRVMANRCVCFLVCRCRRRAALGLVPVQGDRERRALGGRGQGTSALPCAVLPVRFDRLACAALDREHTRRAEFVWCLSYASLDPNYAMLRWLFQGAANWSCRMTVIECCASLSSRLES